MTLMSFSVVKWSKIFLFINRNLLLVRSWLCISRNILPSQTQSLGSWANQKAIADILSTDYTKCYRRACFNSFRALHSSLIVYIVDNKGWFSSWTYSLFVEHYHPRVNIQATSWIGMQTKRHYSILFLVIDSSELV